MGDNREGDACDISILSSGIDFSSLYRYVNQLASPLGGGRGGY